MIIPEILKNRETRYRFFIFSLAASAPIPQGMNTISPTIFFQIVTEDYEKANPDCPPNIRTGFKEILNLGVAKQFQLLSDVFRTCDPIKNEKDVNHLILW